MSALSAVDYTTGIGNGECEAIEQALAQAIRERRPPVMTARQAWIAFQMIQQVAAMTHVFPIGEITAEQRARVLRLVEKFTTRILPEWDKLAGVPG